MQPLVYSLGAIEHSTQVFMLQWHRVTHTYLTFFVFIMFSPLSVGIMSKSGDNLVQGRLYNTLRG
jgi:hypothetical protein